MRSKHPHAPDGHHHHGKHDRGKEGKRLFDYGELRLLLLAMIVEKPSHGYDLMKAIEERMGGSYSPSPGVIYPTLSWLEDMGYAAIDTEQPGRKRYRITAEGEAFLVANRSAADELLTRTSSTRSGGADPVPASVIRAMENLKLALRLRLRGPLDEPSTEAIATALDAAAQAIERS
ncbi:PadR family transcriptional regulator [Rhizobium sp. ICMP 5592]|uniref:PadR family transcriptional regulator n=1 Tax=Rhizobium sp. ICMP 5592 TaxID=2292445 RepID=UPI00129730A4|nr:PadR family transcriptional regulator [Rhizobium sp. ICMP 5592]MQB46458.1 PadR family transcriptional regulator [Rhizobium sp. ICMP 5592]